MLVGGWVGWGSYAGVKWKLTYIYCKYVTDLIVNESSMYITK